MLLHRKFVFYFKPIGLHRHSIGTLQDEIRDRGKVRGGWKRPKKATEARRLLEGKKKKPGKAKINKNKRGGGTKQQQLL